MEAFFSLGVWNPAFFGSEYWCSGPTNVESIEVNLGKWVIHDHPLVSGKTIRVLARELYDFEDKAGVQDTWLS